MVFPKWPNDVFRQLPDSWPLMTILWSSLDGRKDSTQSLFNTSHRLTLYFFKLWSIWNGHDQISRSFFDLKTYIFWKMVFIRIFYTLHHLSNARGQNNVLERRYLGNEKSWAKSKNLIFLEKSKKITNFQPSRSTKTPQKSVFMRFLTIFTDF